MEKKIIYQDDNMTVEIPALLYRIFTSQKKLKPEELKDGIKAMKQALEERGLKFSEDKKQFKVGSQLMFLQPFRFATFTPEFEQVGFVYDALSIIQNEIKNCSIKERDLLSSELEEVIANMLEIKRLYIEFFDKSIGDIDGFIACGDKDLLKVLFIGFDKS